MRYSIVQHGDQLLAQQRSEGDAPDTTLLATDQQRSVLQALKSDHPRQPVAYSPYGHHPVESGLLSLTGFNGERRDPVSGCYLLGNGYRAFNPVLMRFNSPDSLSPFGKGGLNPYAYCLNDPTNRKDRTGYFSSAIYNKLLAWASRAKDKLSISFAQSLGSTSLKSPTKQLTKFSSERTSSTLAKQTSHRAPLQASPLLSLEESTLTLNPRKHQPKTLSQLSMSVVARSEVDPKQIPPSLARDIATESNQQRRIAREAYYNEKPERLIKDIRRERERYLESIGDYKTRFDEFVDSDFSD
jgi:RHS repeat-associated protein